MSPNTFRIVLTATALAACAPLYSRIEKYGLAESEPS